MKAQVADMAFELFLAKGYEQTTIDDICDLAGISRSSFFRYFPAKEDVLTVQTAASADEVLTALQSRPGDEAPWLALRQAVGPVVERFGADPRALRLAELVRATPSLATLHQEKLANWQTLLKPEIARRLGSDPQDATDPRPRSIIAAVLNCLDAAIVAWAAGNGAQQLPGIFYRAMDAIGS